MLKIAISGNIASGKTTVENYIKKFGYKVYDTDKMAHEILETSCEVKKAFTDCYNDRKKLGELVFNNPEKRQLLESITHPIIKERIEALSEEVVFVGIPLLFETKMESLFDKIIFVSAPTEQRLKRLMQRNNLTKIQAMARINSQLPEEEKIKRSDFVIYNDLTLEHLEQQIKKVLSDLSL